MTMVPLKRVPEVMRNDVIMFHPVVQRFTLQRIGTVSHASVKIQLADRMASPIPPKVFAKSFYHLEGSPHFL